MDTKKPERVGDFSHRGREWPPKGRPEQVLVHDFPGDSTGQAISCGIDDLAHNEAWVNVGRDHDPPCVCRGLAAAVVERVGQAA